MFNVNSTNITNTSEFNIQFNPRSMIAPAAFNASFDSRMVLYRGVDGVWLGDGTGEYDGYPDYGVLYVRLVDENIMTLGPISGYYFAVRSGFEGSYSDWITMVSDSAQAMQQIIEIRQSMEQLKSDAEAWAVGQRDGVDVDYDDVTYENNAKYYKEYIENLFASPVTDADIDSLFDD